MLQTQEAIADTDKDDEDEKEEGLAPDTSTVTSRLQQLPGGVTGRSKPHKAASSAVVVSEQI